MTSAVKRTSDSFRRGFTILELVITMGIMILLVGGALAVMLFNTGERRLNNGLSEIELLAKRARTVATLQQRPYALEFTRRGVALMPYAEALIEEDRRSELIEELEYRNQAAAAPGETSGGASTAAVRDGWAPDDESTRLLIRRWGNTDWQLLERRDRHVWRFDPEGICEPVGVRIELENGSWIAGFFHPLTAALTETFSEIQ